MRAKIDAHSEEVLRDVAARYEVLRGPTDPLSFEEYLQSDDGAIAQESMAVLLQNVLNSKLLSRTLSAMIWGWVRIHRSKFGLLTSDIPIMLSNGLGHPDAFVLLPVGPDAIFMASPRREIIQAFTSQKGADLERALNDAVVRQGRNVIIARDARQRRFIDSRFLKGSEPEGDWAVQTWEHPLIDLTKGISAMDPPLGPEIKRQIRLIRNTR